MVPRNAHYEAETRKVVNDFQNVTISGGINYFGSQFNASPQDREAATPAEKLLMSFEYPNQYARAHQISTNFPDTYNWAFEGEIEGFVAATTAANQGTNASSDSGSDDNLSQADSFTFQEEQAHYRKQIQPQVHRLTAWLGNQESLFSIIGKPGSGKSTLMKFLSQQTTPASPELSQQPLTLTHYFWKPGQVREHDINGLLATLTHQMLTSDKANLDVFLQRGVKPDALRSSEQAKMLLFSLLDRSAQDLAIFIDGLDEYEDAHSPQEVLLDLVLELASLPNVKVCISSRPDVFLADTFKDHPSLTLNELTYCDMLSTARGRLRSSERFRSYSQADPSACEELIRKLCTKAEGVFLWLHLALEDLCRGLRKRDDLHLLDQRIDRLETSLFGLFSTMVSNIEAVYRKQTALLCIILLSPTGVTLPRPAKHLVGTELSVMHAFRACHPEIFRPFTGVAKLGHLKKEAEIARLMQQMTDFGLLIRERSAGLIETLSYRARMYQPQRIVTLEEAVRNLERDQIRFVHRSAAEFFRQDAQARQFLDSQPDVQFDDTTFWVQTAKDSFRDDICKTHDLVIKNLEGEESRRLIQLPELQRCMMSIIFNLCHFGEQMLFLLLLRVCRRSPEAKVEGLVCFYSDAQELLFEAHAPLNMAIRTINDTLKSCGVTGINSLNPDELPKIPASTRKQFKDAPSFPSALSEVLDILDSGQWAAIQRLLQMLPNEASHVDTKAILTTQIEERAGYVATGCPTIALTGSDAPVRTVEIIRGGEPVVNWLCGLSVSASAMEQLSYPDLRFLQWTEAIYRNDFSSDSQRLDNKLQGPERRPERDHYFTALRLTSKQDSVLLFACFSPLALLVLASDARPDLKRLEDRLRAEGAKVHMFWAFNRDIVTCPPSVQMQVPVDADHTRYDEAGGMTPFVWLVIAQALTCQLKDQKLVSHVVKKLRSEPRTSRDWKWDWNWGLWKSKLRIRSTKPGKEYMTVDLPE